MSRYPCASEDCRNGADEEQGLCGAHQCIKTLKKEAMKFKLTKIKGATILRTCAKTMSLWGLRDS